MLSQSFFPNFGQGPFPKLAGKGPDSSLPLISITFSAFLLRHCGTSRSPVMDSTIVRSINIVAVTCTMAKKVSCYNSLPP